MKRFKKIIYNCLTVISLVVCLATVGMWVRSYWRADYAARCFAAEEAGEDRRPECGTAVRDGHVLKANP